MFEGECEGMQGRALLCEKTNEKWMKSGMYSMENQCAGCEIVGEGHGVQLGRMSDDVEGKIGERGENGSENVGLMMRGGGTSMLNGIDKGQGRKIGTISCDKVEDGPLGILHGAVIKRQTQRGEGVTGKGDETAQVARVADGEAWV